MNTRNGQKDAQVAIEYLLMLAAVVIVILVAFTTLLPKTQDNAGNFFNQATVRIMGNTAAGSPGKARTSYMNYP